MLQWSADETGKQWQRQAQHCPQHPALWRPCVLGIDCLFACCPLHLVPRWVVRKDSARAPAVLSSFCCLPRAHGPPIVAERKIDGYAWERRPREKGFRNTAASKPPRFCKVGLRSAAIAAGTRHGGVLEKHAAAAPLRSCQESARQRQATTRSALAAAIRAAPLLLLACVNGFLSSPVPVRAHCAARRANAQSPAATSLPPPWASWGSTSS